MAKVVARLSAELARVKESGAESAASGQPKGAPDPDPDPHSDPDPDPAPAPDLDPALDPAPAPDPPRRRSRPWRQSAEQEFLDGLCGSVTVLSPVRGPGGELEDYRVVAASPEAVDIAGRTGKELVGLRVLEAYPTVLGTVLWEGYRSALETGTVWTGAPFEYEEVVAGLPRLSRFRVRAAPWGDRLVVSWVRLDAEEREQRRLTMMQRLGNLGWADWDLVTGTVTWSEQVYTVFGRDPRQGPMSLDELPRHVPPEDLPALEANIRQLLRACRPIDHAFRVTTPTGVRHVRIVAETEQDAEGDAVEVHGFFQDITAAKDIERELIERQIAALAHRSQLNAERDLAARLRRALLPLPRQSLRLAGLQIDVAYQSAEEGLDVGGDWYSAIGLPDGSVFLVVGDVAGHGVESVGTMAQLRFTAKGMAVTGTPLTGILKRLNFLLLHNGDSRVGTTATVIMARYAPDTRTLTWARAGHLPPLLVRARRARYLDLPEGVLLGAARDVEDGRYREATVVLHPGDRLFLYTDGLIERPGEDMERSLGRLAYAVTTPPVRDASLEQLVTALAVPGRRRDDVCVLRVSA